MLIDFTPLKNKELKIADLQDRYTREDLIAATNSMVDAMLDLIRDVPDSYVTFVPVDPNANDTAAANAEEVSISWTLGHVVVHTTASSEEAVAIAATMARGVTPEWRDRYEIHWETVHTTAQLVHRLEESRRMRLAYLNTWPDDPHLDVYFTKLEQHWGKINAVGRVLSGLFHDDDHLGQITEIVRQAHEAGI